MLVITVLGYWAVAYLIQRSILYPAPAAPEVDAAADRPDVKVLWLGPDAKVEAWYLPPRNAHGPAPALIYTHGNGELIDHWLEEFEVPRAWGMGILLVEYPGYGRSRGAPSEHAIEETVIAAYDYLATRPEIDPEGIVAYGRSLGGGAACRLAKNRKLEAMILESTFTGVRPLALRFGLLGPLVRDPFDNLTQVSRFHGPLLIIHGERDAIIPVAHGRTLARAARSAELYLWKGCGHNDCPRPWSLIESFLKRHGILGNL
jgi:hypothetical protein